MEKPFSPSCERNQEPIFQVLQSILPPEIDVLEIASGTGQHALYFSENWPELSWQTSDLPQSLPGIQSWLSESSRDLPAPLSVDLSRDETWPQKQFSAIFTANSLHIVSWPLVESFVRLCAQTLSKGGKAVIYGPVNVGGEYTSESNREFDGWLKERDPQSGIRDLEELKELFAESSLELTEKIAMPANNFILVFEKK